MKERITPREIAKELMALHAGKVSESKDRFIVISSAQLKRVTARKTLQQAIVDQVRDRLMDDGYELLQFFDKEFYILAITNDLLNKTSSKPTPIVVQESPIVDMSVSGTGNTASHNVGELPKWYKK